MLWTNLRGAIEWALMVGVVFGVGAIAQAQEDTKSGGNGTSEEFEALAAQVSGQDLTGFFTAWLRTPAKPAVTADNGLA